MAKTQIFSSGRTGKEYTNDYHSMLRTCAQERVANDIRNKEKKNNYAYVKDDKKFKAGENWFNGGLSLEDASDELKNDISFITGWKYAERQDKAKRDVIALGEDYYLRGVPLGDVPKIYQRNEFFLQGYNNNLNKRR